MQTKLCISYLEDGIKVFLFLVGGGTLMPFPWQFGVGIRKIAFHLVFVNVILLSDLFTLPRAALRVKPTASF